MSDAPQHTKERLVDPKSQDKAGSQHTIQYVLLCNLIDCIHVHYKQGNLFTAHTDDCTNGHRYHIMFSTLSVRNGSTRGDGWLIKGLWMRNPSWRFASMCLEEAADRWLKPKRRVTDGRRARRRWWLEIHSLPLAQLTCTHHFFCFGGGLRTKKKIHGYHKIHSRYVCLQVAMFTGKCSIFGAGLCLTNSMKINIGGGSLVRWLRCLSGFWSGDWSHVILMFTLQWASALTVKARKGQKQFFKQFSCSLILLQTQIHICKYMYASMWLIT